MKSENKKSKTAPEREGVNELNTTEQVQALFPSELKNLLLEKCESERFRTKEYHDV